jgi:hypothetical protein
MADGQTLASARVFSSVFCFSGGESRSSECTSFGTINNEHENVVWNRQ